MRGRLPDTPGLQEAKGNPGRRRSAVQKRIDEAERVAALLSQMPDGADPLATPPIIQGSAPAVAVWRELAPRLRTTHRLQPHHRPIFAMFCVYFAEWVIAKEDVEKNGMYQKVKTVAGDPMERERPILKVRDRAHAIVLNLSERFGLTPSDEYSLFRDQAVAAAQNPGLFDMAPAQHAHPEAPREPESDAGSLIGALKRMDTAPPQRPN